MATKIIDDLTNRNDLTRAQKWALRHPERVSEKKLKWYLNNPEYKPTKEQRRKWYLKSEYGLKEGQWEELFKTQDYKCALCGSISPGNKNGWCTDHDHSTGKVRGILCHRCNTDIGGFDRLRSNPKLSSYLEGTTLTNYVKAILE